MERRPHLLPTEPLRLAGTFWLAVSGWRQVMAVARPRYQFVQCLSRAGCR